MRKLIFAVIATGMLTGCTTGLEQDAVRGSYIAINAYADVYQPAVLMYGQLPPCGPNAPKLCHDKDVYADLKAADLAATKSILAARAVLSGKSSVTGTELSDAMTAIGAAEMRIASRGIMQ